MFVASAREVQAFPAFLDFLAAVSWLALIAFAALTVGPGLTGQKVFLGTDLLSEWAPWQP